MKCAICNENITHKEIKNYLGNNPFPIRLSEEARCCDDCNSRFVIPARIALLNKDVYSVAQRLDTMTFKELKTIFC